MTGREINKYISKKKLWLNSGNSYWTTSIKNKVTMWVPNIGLLSEKGTVPNVTKY